MRIVLAAILVQLLMCAGVARAETPEEVVRGIYGNGGARSSIDRLRAPGNRSRHFQPALVRLFKANDANDAGVCIDFGLHIDGQDFDEAEIAPTLRLEERIDGDKASVDARFSSFRKPNHFRYDFVRAGAVWKIADIASLGDGKWRLSSIRCSSAGQRLSDRSAAPRSTAAAQVASLGSAPPRPPGRYCFANPGRSLKLEIAADRSAQFRIDGGGGTSHICGVEGRARPTAQGWRFEQRVSSGAHCQLDLIQTASGTIVLRDRAHVCRTDFCGAKAGLEPEEMKLSRNLAACGRW